MGLSQAPNSGAWPHVVLQQKQRGLNLGNCNCWPEEVDLHPLGHQLPHLLWVGSLPFLISGTALLIQLDITQSVLENCQPVSNASFMVKVLK